jgi:hypothetical protein
VVGCDESARTLPQQQTGGWRLPGSSFVRLSGMNERNATAGILRPSHFPKVGCFSTFANENAGKKLRYAVCPFAIYLKLHELVSTQNNRFYLKQSRNNLMSSVRVSRCCARHHLPLTTI